MNQTARDQMLMSIALVASQRATCGRRSVGAVISREGRPLTLGYNGAPSGVAHCNHNLAEKPDQACTSAVHAEANAIAFAAKEGVRLGSAELHTTDEPCLACAQLIVNAGIVRVVYGNAYRVPDGHNLLIRAGVEVIHLESRGTTRFP